MCEQDKTHPALVLPDGGDVSGPERQLPVPERNAVVRVEVVPPKLLEVQPPQALAVQDVEELDELPVRVVELLHQAHAQGENFSVLEKKKKKGLKFKRTHAQLTKKTSSPLRAGR